MEESQAVPGTPQHQRHYPHLHQQQQPTNANVVDCLLEMTTDINVPIEEELDDGVTSCLGGVGGDTAAAAGEQCRFYDAPAQTATIASEEIATAIPNKMPMTTTFHESLSSNTTTALVTTIPTTPTPTPTAQIPSSIPTYLTSTYTTTSTAGPVGATTSVANAMNINNRNGNTIIISSNTSSSTSIVTPLASVAAAKQLPVSSAIVITSSGAEDTSCTGTSVNTASGVVLVTTTNNNISLLDPQLIEEPL